MSPYIEQSGDLVGCYQSLTDSLTDWQQNIELLWADNLNEVWSLSWVTQLGLCHSNHLIVVKKVVHWILTNGSKNIVANYVSVLGIFFIYFWKLCMSWVKRGAPNVSVSKTKNDNLWSKPVHYYLAWFFQNRLKLDNSGFLPTLMPFIENHHTSLLHSPQPPIFSSEILSKIWVNTFISE